MMPSASGVGCMDLLERPVRDSKITLDVRARRDNLVAYETTITILRLLRPRRLLRSHLRRVENLQTSRIGRCQSAPNAARTSCARSALSVANRRLRTKGNRGMSGGNLDAPSERLNAAKGCDRAGESEARMKCPKCGYEIEAQQNRAAKSRWSNMTKAERAAEMSRIRKKGVKNQKRTARRSNDKLRDGATERRPSSQET